MTIKINKKLVILIELLIITIELNASLYYNDYIDNERYKRETNSKTTMLCSGTDICAIKMKNDTSPYSFVPTILFTDDIFQRIIWNSYSGNYGVYSYMVRHQKNHALKVLSRKPITLICLVLMPIPMLAKGYYVLN